MNNNLFAEILFNKIIGRKSKIYIYQKPQPPSNDFYRVYYKNQVVGGFTFHNASLTTNRFNLYLFDQKYVSLPLPFLANPNTINQMFFDFLAKLGLTNE